MPTNSSIDIRGTSSVPRSTTIHPVMWHVSASCPRCASPLILSHDRNYQSFLCCDNYPRCTFTTGYDTLVHALLDKIIAQQDIIEDLCGHPIDRSLP